MAQSKETGPGIGANPDWIEQLTKSIERLAAETANQMRDLDSAKRSGEKFEGIAAGLKTSIDEHNALVAKIRSIINKYEGVQSSEPSPVQESPGSPVHGAGGRRKTRKSRRRV
jgi:hypothetical protein